MRAPMRYEALYIHIPFCRAKCAYCDFDSRAYSACALEPAIDAYLGELSRALDAHERAGDLAAVRTVYIGGGTPSILGARLPQLVERVRRACEPVEFTCEANPESFDAALARDLRRAGATRVSLGVQSLVDDELAVIGRIHTAGQALAAIATAKGAGLATSCDLMCGLPLQTRASWRSTLERAIAAAPDHVSVYPLQLEEGTLLARREAAGELEVPDDDFHAACMDVAATLLTRAGFERYEVASYAKPGYRCRHNIAYWTGVPYLGLGRSAASMQSGMGPFRQGGDAAPGQSGTESFRQGGGTVPAAEAALGTPSLPTPASDVARIRFTQLDDAGTSFEHEELTAREAAAEDLMLACRMTDGIGLELLERARRTIPSSLLADACERAVARGLAAWEAGRLKPTHLGWLEGNELFGIFWDLAR